VALQQKSALQRLMRRKKTPPLSSLAILYRCCCQIVVLLVQLRWTSSANLKHMQHIIKFTSMVYYSTNLT
jgi:hypothetical protein